MSFNPKYKATPDTLTEGQFTTGSVDSTGALRVTAAGGVATDAPATGNPVYTGGLANNAAPTGVGNGDVVPLFLTPAGAQVIGGLTLNPAVGLANNGAGVPVASSATARPLVVLGMKFNGSTWDPDRKATTSSRLLSAANSTNSTLIRTGPIDIIRVTGYNASVSVRYLKLYNKATAPTIGTDTPVITLALAPSSVFNVDLGQFYVPLGGGFGLTTGSADADTGAVTAADILGLNIIYTF